ncbi:E3 ubiquitin-protein ligase TRIM56-like [Lissotriton helveticus]
MERMEASLVDVLQKDFLSCGICSDLYKTPKLLPCVHSYCQACLKLLVRDGSLLCPQCSLVVEAKDGTSRLKTNTFLSSLVDLFQSKINNPEMSSCSSCQKAVSPAYHCLNCNGFLCHACANSVESSCVTLDHKVVDLGEFLSGSHDVEARQCQQQFCKDHQQEPLTFYCDTCKMVLCKKCHLLAHPQHPVVTTAEAVLKNKPEVTAMIEGLESHIKGIAEREEQLDNDFEIVQKTAAGIDQGINEYVNKLTSLLLQRKEATLMELDLLLKERRQQHLSMKQELKGQKEMEERTRIFAQMVVDLGKDIDLLSMMDVIKGRIQELERFTPQRFEINIPELVVGLKEKALSEFKHFILRITKERFEGTDANADKRVSLAVAVPHSVALPMEGSLSFNDSMPPKESIQAMQVLHRGHRWTPKLTILLQDSCSDEESDGWLYQSVSSNEYDSTDEGATSDGDDWFLNKVFPPTSPRPICVGSFEINQYMDFAMPKITGLTVNRSGDIIMCDKANDDLKWFSPDGIAGICILPPEPEGSLPLCGLAMCGDIIVCSSGCYLLFLTLQEKLLQKIKLRGPHPPYAIASYKSSYVAVSEGSLCSVSLYKTSGQCVGRVQPAGCQGGKFLFIAINSQEVFIVSDFFQKKIILFKRSGEIVNVLDTSTPLLREPFSLCVDSRDHVFVVDQERVLEFTPDGEFGRVILSTGNGLEDPRLVTVDKKRRLILVHKQDHAKIFQLP